MRNFNTSYIKKSAKSFINANKGEVRKAALLSLIIALVLNLILNLIGSSTLSPLGFVLLTLLLAPVQIGYLNMCHRMNKGMDASFKNVLEYYKNGKKLKEALLTQLYYWGNLVIWFIAYVGCPMGIIYAIWGDTLAGGDALIKMSVAYVVFTGVIIIAAYPYCLHMLKYSGGLFYAGEETHLGIKMRFDIGKDFIKPHVYRYLILSISYAPSWIISVVPIFVAMLFATELGIFAYVLGILGYTYYIMVFMPQFNMASMLMFERMQNPKEEMPYLINGEWVEFHAVRQPKEKKPIHHAKRKGSMKK